MAILKRSQSDREGEDAGGQLAEAESWLFGIKLLTLLRQLSEEERDKFALMLEDHESEVFQALAPLVRLLSLHSPESPVGDLGASPKRKQ